jgi:hypothetical protein
MSTKDECSEWLIAGRETATTFDSSVTNDAITDAVTSTARFDEGGELVLMLTPLAART